MSASEIIDALGGPAAVARMCFCRASSVCEWRRAGIPLARWQFLHAVRPDVVPAPAPPDHIATDHRKSTLRDCMVHQVYARGHGRTANELDIAPSRLTEKLAGADSAGKPRGLTLDEFERYLQKTGDSTPVLYLAAKYLRDPRASQAEALAKLAAFAESLPALLAAAGIEASKR